MSSYVERTPFIPPSAGHRPKASGAAGLSGLYGERKSAPVQEPVPAAAALPEAPVMTPAATRKQTAAAKKGKVSALTVYACLLAFGIFAMMYITHTFAMQQLVQDVSAAQRELERAEMLHERRVLQYEQLTGPSEVFSRARELGFVHVGPADFVIERGR